MTPRGFDDPSTPSTSLSNLFAFKPVGLDDVNSLAGIMRRFDDKFLVRMDDLPSLAATLGAGWRVLEVAGQQVHGYRSIYFDSADLVTYRTHLQGRRRRYKIRTRTYFPSGTTMLELKLKGGAGRTDKQRWTHAEAAADTLDAAATHKLQDMLFRTYGWQLPASLAPSAVTEFERLTLVHLERRERITIDTNLVIAGNHQMFRARSDIAIVETKTPTRAAGAFKAVLKLGHRPVRVSKYCLGVAATRDHIRGNPWLPALRRLQTAATS